MNYRKKEAFTLNFEKFNTTGSVEETFFPWNETVERFVSEGVPNSLSYTNFKNFKKNKVYKYVDVSNARGFHAYENYFGFDGVMRIGFSIPFKCFEETVFEETDEYLIKSDRDGWQRKYYKNSSLVKEIRPVVCNYQDWINLKNKVIETMEIYFSDEVIKSVFTPFKAEHENDEYTIRFRISGFFWTPREVFGIENHLLAFYDNKEIMHEINQLCLDLFIKYLNKVFDIITPDVMLICEDLSGANGPMLSPAMFDEFVGTYYKKLIPFLKNKGIKNVIVDTDGDFIKLIPNFMDCGVDGFIPMDVNAGVDIVKVRQMYPRLKFIGGFNKLCIADGKEAIDKEFERLLPIIRQGGYIPGCDHQVAPSTSLDDYKYYISKLKTAMKQAGDDIK